MSVHIVILPIPVDAVLRSFKTTKCDWMPVFSTKEAAIEFTDWIKATVPNSQPIQIAVISGAEHQSITPKLDRSGWKLIKGGNEDKIG